MAICHLSHYPHLPTTSLLSPKRLDSPIELKLSDISSFGRLALVKSSEKPSYKVRVSRNRKSDEAICEELREFISLAGLPLKRMPSLKVLSDNGRIDLAKVIKKRGYNKVSNLFLSSVAKDEVDENMLDGFLEDEDACKEDQDYRSEDFASSNEFPDMHQVEGNEMMNNYTNSNGTLEDSSAPLVASQTNDTDKAKIIERVDNSANGTVNNEEKPILPLVDNYSSDELINLEEKSVLSVTEPGNYVAINSLKALLDQKDMELTKLKQKIEEEKNEFSKLQEKAKAKIANVELTMKEKCCLIGDAEEKLTIKEKCSVFNDPEEKPKGLKEVRIEFMADAEVVEIAGSFNGWQHRLEMNLDTPSGSEVPSNFRQPKLWSIVLWLYPGVYQIKFVVDGNWRVDPKREVDAIGNFANNVLRVEL